MVQLIQLNQAHHEEEPPAYTSPAANYETPAVAISKSADDVSPIPPPNFGDRSINEQQTSPSNESAFGSAASVKAGTANVITTSSDDVKTKLVEANAQIQRLKSQIADQGLRQRKVGAAGGEATTSTLQQQQPQSVEAGVPVQIVAALCLLSFLLAYFFF